jgi:hypothetical protein
MYQSPDSADHLWRDEADHIAVEPIGPSDNAELVARRLLREKLASNADFNAPINYPRPAIP